MRAGKFDLLVGSLLLAVSSVAGSVAFAFHDEPLETDAALTLAGAHWVADDYITSLDFSFDVDFYDADGIRYDRIIFEENANASGSQSNYRMYYHEVGEDDDALDPAYVAFVSGWVSDSYKSLTFTGGADISASRLVSFLDDNGVLSFPYSNVSSMLGEAYSEGFSDAGNVEQQVLISRSSSSQGGSVYVSASLDGESIASNQELDYYHNGYMVNRSSSSDLVINLSCSDGYSMLMYYLTDDQTEYLSPDWGNPYIYLPYWVPFYTISIQLVQSVSPAVTQTAKLRVAPDTLSEIRVGFSGTAVGSAVSEANSAGYSVGYQDGYHSGQNVGASAGYSNGYSYGYDVGFDAGYAANAEDGAPVIDIWKLLSMVVTMPFTFVSQGLDWTLFAGTKYEFSVSVFFGSLLVLLMLWKVLQLVIGFFK